MATSWQYGVCVAIAGSDSYGVTRGDYCKVVMGTPYNSHVDPAIAMKTPS